MSNQLSKYSTAAVQDALISLRTRNDELSNIAFRIAFDELNKRMGDEAFDKFCDEKGI